MEKYDLFSSRKAAELYATKQPELRPEVIDHVLEHAPGRDTLLDVGCGSGSSTRPFAPHFGKVIGVDYSPTQIELAKELTRDISNVNYHMGSIYDLPVPDNSVDCIIGVMIAQFIDLTIFYKEVDRVLKHGGVIIFHGKSSFRITETESETTALALNQRIVNVKNELFAGLWHDRTYFNPHKYTNIPDLYPNCFRKEWLISDPFGTAPDNIASKKKGYYDLVKYVDYMLTFSASGKYCLKEGVTFEELKEKLLEMLRGGAHRIRFKCEYDAFVWHCAKPN